MDEIVEYMVYCCATQGKREMMMARKLVAVNFFHFYFVATGWIFEIGLCVNSNSINEQWLGRSLPIDHFRIKTVKEGIKKAHVEGVTQQRVRMPLLREILKITEGMVRSGEWAEV